MRAILLVGFFLITPLCAATQSSELRIEQQYLTDNCKSMREYATKIAAEANKPELKREVALVHSKEVMNYLNLIEQRMKATKNLLSNEQLKTVAQEFGFMERGCSTIRELAKLLQKELEKRSPDHASVKKLAAELRMEMAGLYNIHELAKKKLGL